VCTHEIAIALFAGFCQGFVARSRLEAYVGSSPVTTDNASCFDTSRFSTIIDLECNIMRNRGGICTRLIEYLSKPSLPTQSSVQKEGGGAYFRELMLQLLAHTCSAVDPFESLIVTSGLCCNKTSKILM